ncbi:membrane protein insertion efficiency factor YidD [Campylobacter sp. MIT 97-5078]|uniref:membrane protein insertion efficiency factor YidD n=1 Tax=Campylobacter sp. MIT 97-5078 TaxID=1548153 RepID=UPI0005132362|nr:membrane protein insertion efficiency factor YidD [Campylobacter sp. MIT 97-5078]KGI56144.1 membrane protein insertion efficiency factor [Campylobacter sp. MIT 97-5078]TQR27971.1 membrane protein insertion efficiency factor YidD [Campylobacter sp. MIT 97-5078]
MFKMICVKTIAFYQHFLSPLKPRVCRFYPSCSEYAKWQFEKRNFFVAFVLSLWRILRCNPYFQGGFDYPKIAKLDFKPSSYKADIKIKFFYIPYAHQKFYIVKKVF